MSVQTALAAGRRSAERLMTARCQITRKKLVTLDTATLRLTDDDPTDDLVYAGPCRLRTQVARVTTGDFEGQLLAAQQVVLALPISDPRTGDVRPGDAVEILDGGDDPSLGRPDPADPSAPGLVLRVQGRPLQTQATAHRFPVEYTG